MPIEREISELFSFDKKTEQIKLKINIHDNEWLHVLWLIVQIG